MQPLRVLGLVIAVVASFLAVQWAMDGRRVVVNHNNGQQQGVACIDSEYPIVPAVRHGSGSQQPFLVAVGIFSMDSENGHHRRDVIRNSWMTYRDVWHNKTPNGSVIVRFLLGRDERHEFQLSSAAHAEATAQHSDVIVTCVREYKATSGKNSSNSYGLWGIRVEITMIRKSFLWRKLAVDVFPSHFVAKADDDVYVVVPVYVATLMLLPRMNVSYGRHATVPRLAAHTDSSFPYVLGPLVTHSADVARVIASSSLVEFFERPFSGRPSDYGLRRVDHEDYAIGNSVDIEDIDLHVINDCRIIEPFLDGNDYQQPGALTGAATRRNDSQLHPGHSMVLQRGAFVAFHKLNITLFDAARKWFGELSTAPEVSLKLLPLKQFANLRSRIVWSNVGENPCKVHTVEGYTLWPELGSISFRAPPALLHHMHLPYQPVTDKTVFMVLAVITTDMVARSKYRELAFGTQGMWSIVNRTHPLLLRFPLFSKKSLQRAPYWETHLHQDMIVIKRAPPQTADRRILNWLLVANILYPQALFHVVCNHPPPMQLPWTIYMSINKALPASVVGQRGKVMTYFRDNTTVIVSKPISRAIVAQKTKLKESSSTTTSWIDSLVAQCARRAATGTHLFLQCTSAQHEFQWRCCPLHASSTIAERSEANDTGRRRYSLLMNSTAHDTNVIKDATPLRRTP